MRGFEEFVEDRGGQLTIVGLLTIFLELVVYAAMLPSINQVVNDLMPNLDPTSQMIVSLLPLFLTVAITANIFIYMSPQYPT